VLRKAISDCVDLFLNSRKELFFCIPKRYPEGK
jgi:hypothetical protein